MNVIVVNSLRKIIYLLLFSRITRVSGGVAAGKLRCLNPLPLVLKSRFKRTSNEQMFKPVCWKNNLSQRLRQNVNPFLDNFVIQGLTAHIYISNITSFCCFLPNNNLPYNQVESTNNVWQRNIAKIFREVLRRQFGELLTSNQLIFWWSGPVVSIMSNMTLDLFKPLTFFSSLI